MAFLRSLLTHFPPNQHKNWSWREHERMNELHLIKALSGSIRFMIFSFSLLCFSSGTQSESVAFFILSIWSLTQKLLWDTFHRRRYCWEEAVNFDCISCCVLFLEWIWKI
jgi:hypothetical protein